MATDQPSMAHGNENHTELPVPSGSSRSGTPRHISLLQAIARSRQQLNDWQDTIDAVQLAFRTRIEPRERAMTGTVLSISEQLIQLYGTTALNDADRSLLGLWINENLGILASHPFAPASETQTLAMRWQETLARAAGAIDQELTRMRNRRDRSQRVRKHYPDEDPDEDYEDLSGRTAPREADAGGANDQMSFAGGAAASGINDGSDKTSVDPPDRGQQQAPGSSQQETTASTTAGDATQDLKALIDLLFRALAARLHPDREQDPDKRKEKDQLMSLCLEAREAMDIDQLLTLYNDHVGDLPPELTTGNAQLIQSLEKQLLELRRRWHRLRFGDALGNGIMDRYAGIDAHDRETRFAHHANALDVEIAQLQTLLAQLDSQEGFRQALLMRRDRELDRLAINQLTGL